MTTHIRYVTAAYLISELWFWMSNM